MVPLVAGDALGGDFLAGDSFHHLHLGVAVQGGHGIGGGGGFAAQAHAVAGDQAVKLAVRGDVVPAVYNVLGVVLTVVAQRAQGVRHGGGGDVLAAQSRGALGAGNQLGPIVRQGNAVAADGDAVHHSVHVVLAVAVVVQGAVKFIPAVGGVHQAVVKHVPGGPAPAAVHHGAVAHVGAVVAVVRRHVVAQVDADVAVGGVAVVVGHRHHQAVDAGDAVQLVKVPGKRAVVLYLGRNAAIAAGFGA